MDEKVTHTAGVVFSLAGSGGEHMPRWGSLSVTISEVSLGEFTLLSWMGSYFTPNQQQLEIPEQKIMDGDFDEEVSFREMPRLRSLKVNVIENLD